MSDIYDILDRNVDTWSRFYTELFAPYLLFAYLRCESFCYSHSYKCSEAVTVYALLSALALRNVPIVVGALSAAPPIVRR